VKTKKANESAQSIGPRKAGFVAGLSILAMIYPAMVVLTMLESVMVKGDAAQTVQNVLAVGGFGLGVWIMLGIVVILDVVASVALWKFFASASTILPKAVMVTRLGYTVIFAVAILQLTSAASDSTQSLVAITHFNDIWHASLLIFGIHLLLIGWLVVRLAFTSTHLYKATGVIVGGLLLVGGAGYLIDNIGLLFIPGYETATVMVVALAAGETLFALWLFSKSLGFFGIPMLVRKF
jgi:uncharacterized protein DUF4386